MIYEHQYHKCIWFLAWVLAVAESLTWARALCSLLGIGQLASNHVRAWTQSLEVMLPALTPSSSSISQTASLPVSMSHILVSPSPDLGRLCHCSQHHLFSVAMQDGAPALQLWCCTFDRHLMSLQGLLPTTTLSITHPNKTKTTTNKNVLIFIWIMHGQQSRRKGDDVQWDSQTCTHNTNRTKHVWLMCCCLQHVHSLSSACSHSGTQYPYNCAYFITWSFLIRSICVLMLASYLSGE